MWYYKYIMPEINKSFAQEIDKNTTTETAPSSVIETSTDKAALGIRERGGFIVNCELTSPSTDERYSILYSSSEISTAKLIASHIMSPVGPSEEIGGQHGFPRWADYHSFPVANGGQASDSRIAIQAKRSDTGLSVAKIFELSDSALLTNTTLFNSESNVSNTSLGEHLYFLLTDEDFNGLRVDGKSLDELLGDKAEESIKAGNSRFWNKFSGETTITFPGGYTVRLSASSNKVDAPLGMLVWHKPGSPSICFEPTLGFNNSSGNKGLEIASYDSVTLSTRIELE